MGDGTRRVLTVAHVLAPASFGGLESVVAGLSKGQSTRGIRVILVVVLEPGTDNPSWIKALRAADIEVVVVFARRLSYLREITAVRRLLSERNVDILHTHGERCDVVHLATASLLGVPIVSTVHGFSRQGRLGRVVERIQSAALARFTRVVVVAQSIRTILVGRGVSDTTIVCIQNGLASEAAGTMSRAEARTKLGIPQTGSVVGWVGRMSPEKAPDVMVRAFASMASKHARLCMIGDGPMSAELSSLARALGIEDRITFTGALSQAATLFKAFDLFGLSSHSEGTPMVLLEAAAAGVPIVATSVGGIPALVGSSATLVPAADPRALARAMDDALEDCESAAAQLAPLHASVTDPARRERWIDRYCELYRTVVSRGIRADG